ncbi:MAG: Hint domain-containing protein [Proteobacteria bacterium]|nr:Hint domain-containing protein [Pseudomonadota bacterium]
MKKILLLSVMLFSVISMASSSNISCDGRGYRVREFTQSGEKEPSIGLINGNAWFFYVDKNQDYVWTKMHKKSIENCSIFDEGFAIGGKNPVANIEDIKADKITDGRFLGKIFDCFCKINRNLLNNCTMEISYEGIFDGFKGVYAATLTCVNGSIEENGSIYISLGGSCFVAGTKVLTPSGDKNIEDFKIGDDVLAYDHKDNVVKTSKVTKVFKHKNKKYGELYLSNGSKLLVTAEHRFYSVDKKKYVRADKLKADEKLLVNNGKNTETVTVTKYVESVAKADVYNITVKDFNNYFAEKILVHNLK